MDGSKGRPKMTAGLDLGDKYSYLCLIDTESGENMEEGLLCAQPQRPSDDAPPPRGPCASQSRPEPTRRGQAGF
jgi:hypothetical protein